MTQKNQLNTTTWLCNIK